MVLPIGSFTAAAKTNLAERYAGRDRFDGTQCAPLSDVEQFTGGRRYRSAVCDDANNLRHCARIGWTQWTTVGFLDIDHIGPAGECRFGFLRAAHAHQQARRVSTKTRMRHGASV